MRIVIRSLCLACEKLLLIIALCAHVIEIPDASKIKVFNNGILIGLKDLIPKGGHCIPTSTAGDNLLWKNAQKNDEKNSTSDMINSIIPHFILLITFLVCSPWNVDSRITSRHHWIIVNTITVAPRFINNIWLLWSHVIVPEAVVIIPIDAVRGQGLFSTRWNGWFFI